MRPRPRAALLVAKMRVVRTSDEAAQGRSRRRRVVLALVTAVTLVLVARPLVRVYRETPTALGLPAGWLVLLAMATTAQFASTWILQRTVLRAERWLDVAAPELVGNAASHLVPAGNAAGAGVQLRLLTEAGFPLANALTGLGASSLLSTAAGLVVLPFLVLVATAVGSDVAPGLVRAMWAGAILLGAILVGLGVGLGRDGPWRAIASATARVQRRRGRAADQARMEATLLEERDLVRATLRQHGPLLALAAVARPGFDYLCLLGALHAVGARINPAAVLAAFIVSNIAGMVPLTPGGLGFVEAGLSGTLRLAGVTGRHAHAAVATYRLIGTWLPILGGGVAYLFFRRRHPRRPPSG